MSRQQNVRETSLQAFRGVDLSRRQAEVVAFLKRQEAKDFTRGEIAKESKIPINVVCPRVLELIEAGVLEERPIKRSDRYSGRQCFTVRLAPRQAALELA